MGLELVIRFFQRWQTRWEISKVHMSRASRMFSGSSGSRFAMAVPSSP